MTKIKVYLTTGRDFTTEVDSYDAQEIADLVKSTEENVIAIGTLAFRPMYFLATAPVEVEVEGPVQ